MAKETFIIVMPVYNEGQVISRVITEWSELVKKHPGSEILIINDGSTDNTQAELDKLKKRYRFLKIIHKQNSGHGQTIKLGYKKAVNSHHQWVFQTDSDNQFLPPDFEKLWIHRKKSNFILGHRTKRNDPYHRILLSSLSRLCIFVIFGVDIPDPNIPFRLIRRVYLKKLLALVPPDVFAPNIFLAILAAKDKQNLVHVPVTHLKRLVGHSSIANWRLISVNLRSLTELIKYRFVR